MDELIIEFKRWLRDSGFNDDIEFKWWNIDTSFLHILKILKGLKRKQFIFVGSCFEEVCKNQNRILVSGLEQEKARSTIQQYISVGIIFGAIKINRDLDFKNKIDLFTSWANKDIQLNFSDEFLGELSAFDYLYNKIDFVFQNLRLIENNFKNSFMYNDMYRILFDLYLFFLQGSKKIACNSIEYKNILDKYKQKKNSDCKSWESWYDSNSILLQFSCYLFEKKYWEIDSINSLEQNKIAAIGMAGEYLFNILAKNKEQFIEKIDHPKVKKMSFLTTEWSSQKNKYCPYDFKVNNVFFEVKSTTKNYKKDSFILSENEFNHMKKYEDYSYLCFLKNINIDEIDFKNEKNNFRTIKKIDINFFDFKDIINNFNLTNKGYWVTAK